MLIKINISQNSNVSIIDSQLVITNAPIVVEYDPDAVENKVSTEITEFEIISGSAVISNGVMSIGPTPMYLGLSDGSSTQLSAIKMPLKIGARINIDTQKYNDYICGFALIKSGESLQEFIENYVFIENSNMPSPFPTNMSFLQQLNQT